MCIVQRGWKAKAKTNKPSFVTYHSPFSYFSEIYFKKQILLLNLLHLPCPVDPFVSLPLHFHLPPHYSPSVGLPPSPLAPPRPLLSAPSHQSSTGMRSSSGHNGDHMLKPTLKPYTGHPHQIKPAVSSGGLALPRGVKPYLSRPHRHAINWDPRSPAERLPRKKYSFMTYQWRRFQASDVKPFYFQRFTAVNHSEKNPWNVDGTDLQEIWGTHLKNEVSSSFRHPQVIWYFRLSHYILLAYSELLCSI